MGQRGHAVQRLVPAPSGRAKALKRPQNMCLCTGKGLMRRCSGGTGAHRPCSSSRKLNEEKKGGHPPLPRAPNAKCVLHIANTDSSEAPEGRLAIPSAPTQDTTGFFSPAAKAKRQPLLPTPHPSLPRHQQERGREQASLISPSPRKASNIPKQKTQPNK